MATVGVLAGCASQDEPATAADVMRGYATDAQESAELRNELAESWDRGQELAASGREKVDTGQEKLAKAEQDLREAEALISEGRREVTQGNALVQESERRFRENFPRLELRPER